MPQQGMPMAGMQMGHPGMQMAQRGPAPPPGIGIFGQAQGGGRYVNPHPEKMNGINIPTATAELQGQLGQLHHSGQSETVFKYTFDNKTKEWKQNVIVVSIGKEIGRGAMRIAHHMLDLSAGGDYVAKSSQLPGTSQQDFFQDCLMQAICVSLSDAYNKRTPPKQARFIDAFLIERVSKPGKPLYACESRLKGKWEKWSNNDGWVGPDDQNTPQAFSHFTYWYSQGKMIVVDLQGVCVSTPDGNQTYILTDPQIHSHDKVGYGKGNNGQEGFNKFFGTHKCNEICVGLSLCTKEQQKDFRGTGWVKKAVEKKK
jgi:elongation factor 2 kinase